MTEETVFPRTLVTVSGTIPSELDRDIADGRRPRPDYAELARRLDADLLDVPAAIAQTGIVGRVVAKLAGSAAVLAVACHRCRRNYDVVLTDGEQVGLPMAALSWFTRRRPRHVMIVHIMSPAKKRIPFRLLGLARHVDRYLVYASAQQRLLVDQLGVRAERVVLIPFMADTRFWSPEQIEPTSNPASKANRPLLASAGLEFRDYPTLVEAVRTLDVQVVLAAASPWSKRRDSSSDTDIPENVVVDRLDFFELRALYGRADLVVVPLVETDFQAGITTILEAMSMGRPLVVTRTTGQTDTIEEGITGRYVPPGDADALRDVIRDLLAEPGRAGELGQAARRWVVEHADIEVYASMIADVIASVASARQDDEQTS